MNIDTYTWKEIAEEFNDDLILGNGASMAIGEEIEANYFSYHYLFEVARKAGHLTEEVRDVFKKFDTKNFEIVLDNLRSTMKVNEVVEKNTDYIEELYEECQKVLIDSIRDSHPNHQEVEDLLLPAAKFMDRFDRVFSLNYDLMVYWAMMKGRNKIHKDSFKDCFGGEDVEDFLEFDEIWERRSQSHSTFVFYPHGNLVLMEGDDDKTKKLKSGSVGDNLLDRIIRIWRNFMDPVFVSEGESEEKRQEIGLNDYLSAVYDKAFDKINSNLTIFGWSVSEQDEHILNALPAENIERIAMSVYPKKEKKYKIFQRREKLEDTLEPEEIIFFNSESEGCWINCEK